MVNQGNSYDNQGSLSIQVSVDGRQQGVGRIRISREKAVKTRPNSLTLDYALHL